MKIRSKWLLPAALLVTCALAISACGGSSDSSSSSGGQSGSIKVDGSSTVYPLTQAVAEMFKQDNPDVKISVSQSGTGGGFEKFCAGETDISDASREIEPDEVDACKKGGVEFVGLKVGSDGISIVTNKENNFAKCLTVDQLKQVWERGSKVDNWNKIDSSFPNKPLKLYGPGTDSGTFDFFTDKINGEEGNSRSDYTASEDDNVLVKGVEGDTSGMGYFGFSYYEQNKDRLHLIGVDDGSGCVTPAVENIQSGEYKPLSRPLLIYPSKKAATDGDTVKSFVDYYLDNAVTAAETAQLVPATQKEIDESKAEFEKFAS